MKVRNAAVVAILVLLVACGSAENATAPAESAGSANKLFDSAVRQITTAYFSHVPESTTALGIPETVVLGTGKRMMDRSVTTTIRRLMARVPVTTSSTFAIPHYTQAGPYPR